MNLNKYHFSVSSEKNKYLKRVENKIIIIFKNLITSYLIQQTITIIYIHDIVFCN